MGFTHFLFKDSIIFIKGVLRSLSCASAMLQFSGTAVVGLLGFCVDNVLAMFLCWCLGICVWDDCNSRC